MLGKSLDPIYPCSTHLHNLVKDDIIQRNNLPDVFTKRSGIIFDASDHDFDLLKTAIAQRNIPFCQVLIKYNACKIDFSYLKQSIDFPEVFDVLLNECTESDAVLEILYELISRENLPLIKKIIDKYHHYVSVNTWQDTWKTNNTIMEKCLDKKTNLEIALYLATMGFSVTIDILRRFVNANDEAATHSLISARAINHFDRNMMQGIFNTFFRKAHISNAEAVRQLMIQKGYKFELRLGKCLKSLTIMPLLMSVPLSKVYDVVSYAIQHCQHFDLIKGRVYENDGRTALPETVLSYLAFVSQFDAMKLIIENPDCSFKPSHLVVCSLFRGHYTSRYHNLPLPIYDEIFDYLMRDDIRPRVLGDDKVWIDKSVFIAIRYGNERMVKKLVDLGADLTNIFITSSHYLNRATYARYSLLSYACEYQTGTLVEFLIEKGIPVEGTMIDALGEPMIEVGNIDMVGNDNHNDKCNHNDDDGVDEADVDEVDANETDDGNNFDMEHKFQFHFSSDRFGEIKNSLYPKYFNLPKINRNRDLGSPSQFDYRKRGAKHVYLFNMTPLGVAIYKNKVDVVKLLLLHGANPMGKCMTNFPALFCLTHDYIEYKIRDFGCNVVEEIDDEIIKRYPLKKKKNEKVVKGSNHKHRSIEPLLESYESHFVTTLSETIKCVNIKTFLAKYSHTLECGPSEFDTFDPKRQRRLGFVSRTEIVDMPVQVTRDTPAIVTTHSPHSPNFIYRNNTPELLQLLIEYGAPAMYDTQKLGVKIPGLETHTSLEFINVEYTIENLLTNTATWADYGANTIIFLAKNNMISLEKFDEFINCCLSREINGLDTNTEAVVNVCELLSAIIYPADNLVKSAAPLSTFDQKVALTSGILDSAYSDQLYEIALEKICGSCDSDIEVFMRLTKAYPRLFYLNMQHSSGKSLLHRKNVVRAYNLVQLGFDVNYSTPLGDSLLRQTIKNVNTDNIEIIYRLVIFGADINKVGFDGINCEQAMQKSSYPQSLKDFMKRCARIMELSNIMNQYQSDKCVCLQCDDSRTTYAHAEDIEGSSRSASLTISPFSRDDYDLLASSCVPEYTYDTLSYFFSACSSNCTPAVCVSCKEILSKNDHCRPYQTIPSSEDENCLPTSAYIHDKCFFRQLKIMIRDCNTKSMETGFPKYIRNPTKRYNAPNI